MKRTNRSILPLLALGALLLGGCAPGAGETSDEETLGEADQALDQSCFEYVEGQWLEFDCFEGGGDWDPPGPGEGDPTQEGGDPPEAEDIPVSLDAGIVFSSSGPIYGKYCTQIYEGSDLAGGWNNNYLCSNIDFGFQWSYNGTIAGKRCYQVKEPAEPYGTRWGDNYLCVNTSAPVVLYWSYSGTFADWHIKSVQWYEPLDPHTWTDNYLGYYYF